METSIEDYLKRSGDKELLEGELEENEHGFCIWQVNNDKLVLIQVYGNGIYWDNWASEKAREMNLKEIFFATRRNPQGFVRKYGYEVIGYILKRNI